MKRNITAFVVLMVLMLAQSVTVLASSGRAATAEREDYQVVLDRLNSEYGTDIWIASEKQSGTKITEEMSLVEFEKFATKIAERWSLVNAEVLAAESEAERQGSVTEELPFTFSSSGNTGYSPRSTWNYSKTKTIYGGRGTLNATVTNDPGWVQFFSVFSVNIVASSGYPSIYSVSGTTKNLMDVNETCRVTISCTVRESANVYSSGNQLVYYYATE
ncbi:MAG: hypothetical protein LBQ19_00485 [Synergistaceae bacterium]|jgi:hypothetical protein|nr:hypothetical protein [Synergistaceae bacterium]